jgi:hydrogenase nickel incorporation protein HypA/HybF
MGIALDILRICRETMRAHGGGRLETVRVALGELTAVEPELLVFAWEAALGDGPDAGAEVVIDWCPAVQRCDHCGEVKERGQGSWLRLCPSCRRILEVTGGRELDILEVTFAQDEREAPADGVSPRTAEEA